MLLIQIFKYDNFTVQSSDSSNLIVEKTNDGGIHLVATNNSSVSNIPIFVTITVGNKTKTVEFIAVLD